MILAMSTLRLSNYLSGAQQPHSNQNDQINDKCYTNRLNANHSLQQNRNVAMAFKKCLNEICGTVLVLSALLSSASAVDCHGKSFHCVNSTHFMICVDLGGGVSQSIDSFLIPCPPPTVCLGTNRYECEFPAPTTHIPTLSDVIIETTQPWEDVIVTTNSPQKKTTKEYSEKYINTESLMSLADSFTKDVILDYTTEVAPSSLADVNSQKNKTATVPVTTESIFYDTTIVPAIKESTFNNNATNGLEQVIEIAVENFATDATEVITEIPLIETTIAEPTTTQVYTETTGITTVSSDDNSNLSLSTESSTTTDITSRGVLDYTGANVLHTDPILSDERSVTVAADSYTTEVNVLTIEQSEFMAPDVVHNAENKIMSEQITTTDSTFDTKSLNTDQPHISILPVMTTDTSVNLITARQSPLPDDLQNVFDQSPTTLDTVFSYGSVTYLQDINEESSTTDLSNFAQNGDTEQSKSNGNDIYTTDTPFTAPSKRKVQVLLIDDKDLITESTTLINNDTTRIAENVSTTNNIQKKTKEKISNTFTTTEHPLTDSLLIFITNTETASTEKIPVIPEDTKLNIEKNTNEIIQDRATTSGYIHEVLSEQPNTNTFENDLAVTTSLIAASEISDTIPRTLGSTKPPTPITFEDIYQTVRNDIYITESSTVSSTNDQESQQSINEETVIEANPGLMNRNNLIQDAKHKSTDKNTNPIFNQSKQVTTTETGDINDRILTVQLKTTTFDNEPKYLTTEQSTSIENFMQTEITEKTSAISDITTTPATKSDTITTNVVKQETNINKSRDIIASYPSISYLMKSVARSEDRNDKIEDKIPGPEISMSSKKEGQDNNYIADTANGMETDTTYNTLKEIVKSDSMLNTNIVQSVVHEENTEGKLLKDRIANNAIIPNTTASIAVPNNFKQNNTSSETDTHNNVNENIADSSALPITNLNDFSQTAQPYGTDTIYSVNENIVTTSVPSTTGPRHLKQNGVSSELDTNHNGNGNIIMNSATTTADTIPNVKEIFVTSSALSTVSSNLKHNTISSGSGTNTNENENIVTPSAVPITDQNDFNQTAAPIGTYTIRGMNENIVTTSAPSITYSNDLKRTIPEHVADTITNVIKNIVTTTAPLTTDLNDLKQNILGDETNKITNVVKKNIVIASAPSLVDPKYLKQNAPPHGTDITFTSPTGNIALSKQTLTTLSASNLEDQTNRIITTNFNIVEASTYKHSDSKLSDHNDVSQDIKSNSGSTVTAKWEHRQPSNDITENVKVIADIINSFSTSKPAVIDVSSNKYQNNYIQISEPKLSVEKDVHGTIISSNRFASTINTNRSDKDIVIQNNEVTTEYTNTQWIGTPISIGITGISNFTSNPLENNVFFQINSTLEPLIEAGIVMTGAYNDKIFTTSESPSLVPTKDTITKSTIVENVQNAWQTITNLFNTAYESSTQGVEGDSSSQIQSVTEIEILSQPKPGNNNIKTESNANGVTTQSNIFTPNVQPQTSFSTVKETNNILQPTGTMFPLTTISVKDDITKSIHGKESIHNLGRFNLASKSIIMDELKNESPITVTTSTINRQSDSTTNDEAQFKPVLISKSAGPTTVVAQPTISQSNVSKLPSLTKANLGNSSTITEKATHRRRESQAAVINNSSLLILQNSTNSVTTHDSKLLQSAQSKQLATVTEKAFPKIITPVTITLTSTERIIQTPVAPGMGNPKKQVKNNFNRKYSCINGLRGRYSDKDDCRKFYICVGNTEPIVGYCPVDTVFSDIKKLCTKNMSHCIRENEFKCPSAGRFSDVARENVYYICVSHNNHLYRFKFQCQIGFTLNKTTVRCVENKEIESNESVSISIGENASDSDSSSNKITSGSSSSSTRSGSTSSSSSGRSKSSSSGDSDFSSSKSQKSKEKPEGKDEDDDEEVFVCEKVGKFPVRNDCRRYYLCKKNGKSQFRRKLKKCESGDVFHKSKKRCVDADSYEC